MAFGWLLRNTSVNQNHHSGHCLTGMFKTVTTISREHPEPKAAESLFLQQRKIDLNRLYVMPRSQELATS